MNMSMSRYTRVIASCLLCALPALAIFSFSFNTPTATATVGVPYSSSCTASGGNPPLTYSISSGALPTSLNLNTSTGAITGTPTVSGIFTFTCFVSDTPILSVTSPADATKRVIAKSGSPTATGTSSSFTITVAPGASPTPVPPSIWMAVLGLAGAGLFRMRQLRRA